MGIDDVGIDLGQGCRCFLLGSKDTFGRDSGGSLAMARWVFPRCHFLYALRRKRKNHITPKVATVTRKRRLERKRRLPIKSKIDDRNPMQEIRRKR